MSTAPSNRSDEPLSSQILDKNENDTETPYQLSTDDSTSIETAEGIHDPHGFLCVCAVILLGDMSRGVFFPSLWSLVSTLGGSQVTLGYAVASFSLGRVLVNPLFGSWSHVYGYSFTLITACCILWSGTILYSFVFQLGRCEYLLVAQTVLGVGSGTLGVTRAFVADVTAQRLRTQYMAYITAVQYAGFTVTPLLGYAMNRLFPDEEAATTVNRYTAPAYFMTITSTLVLILLLTTFRNRQRVSIRQEKKQKSQKRAAIDQQASQIVPIVGLSIYDCCIAGCLLLNISTKGSIASFETMGVAVADSHFAAPLEHYAGLVVGLSGMVGVIVLLFMGHLTALWTDIQLIVGGMVIMAFAVAMWTTLEESNDNPAWKYVTTIFLMYAVGYPVGHTTVIGLFSKIVGRRPQGTLLGWFASAGSLARMLFPIMSGYVSRYDSVQLLFGIVAAVLVVATIVTTWARQTLTMLSQ